MEKYYLEEIRLSRELAREVADELESMPSKVQEAFEKLRTLYTEQIEEGVQ